MRTEITRLIWTNAWDAASVRATARSTSARFEKLNTQIDEGPTENLNSYLNYDDKINKMIFSIGATRYTDFGKTHFLQENDKSVVVLYPDDKYSYEEILSVVKNKDFSHSDISLLYQEIVISGE